MDIDDRYLNQARFAAQTLGLEIEFEKLSVYDVDQIAGQFDYVLFLGVFYHLRYPLYALDKVIKKVGGKLLFQTMIRGSEKHRQWEEDYHFWNKQIFESRDFPRMFFIEHSYAERSDELVDSEPRGGGSMLRSSGLEIVAHPEAETWMCMPRRLCSGTGSYILDLELDGTL